MANPTVGNPFVLIPVRSGGKVAAHAIVDEADAGLASRSWHMDPCGYARLSRRIDKRVRTFRMHRVILGLAIHDQREVDHINRNKLDNRRANLCIADRFENMQNRGAQRNSRSGILGVRFHEGSWQGRVKHNKKSYYCGSHATAELATNAVIAMRRKLGVRNPELVLRATGTAYGEATLAAMRAMETKGATDAK